MFWDFNCVHGRVICAKHGAFTYAEAPSQAAIDLEERSSKYETEDPSTDTAFHFKCTARLIKFEDQKSLWYKSQMYKRNREGKRASVESREGKKREKKDGNS